ncbi:LysR family transcriptional regulator [Mycobacterium paraense]|uniref:LysR family transcriptional regulator n=1 Tax=Mycobacterium paraense TaxID=767916 RepID=A0A1X2AE01_9MYCO|nr:LysR family transcriptional regulator [Mycobacterium paraense]MCV7445201.1 LysR family transcriptional regulator [Mycobacterium paraense]ORW29421.1 LysR family transcriptional regulator [Mycobacterium paraense]ORW45811.1 LysR family transcriptional regulator [Mycobacterium paraense]ORW46468.1 LysR family transcriptional regulator [Mycobacterium paraense]ORW49550.1 LysR family transcriptional regulator [Mycobacterium paraense]
MTPAQLRAYSAVVRLGSVRAAAAELGVSDAGISMLVTALRKELDDPLFTRTGAGLAFTPGGLRLASRAVEILGLQQQTAIEVTEAAHGRRLLRIAASTAFAEHAAPGLIELFSSRANDLSVELSVHPTSRFRDLICSRAVDIAIGPVSEGSIAPDDTIFVRPFLKYQIIAVAAPNSPVAAGIPAPALLRQQQWMLGPSAGSVDGEIANMLRGLAIPESQQRIFQSDAAALEEVQRVGGVGLTIGFAVAKDLAAGRLTHVSGPGLDRSGEWGAATLAPSVRQPAVSELVRFITTPRCTQAMIRGSGVGVTRFRPKVHVTLWS